MDELEDDDVLLQIEEPHFVLDPACPTCRGKGVMEEGGRLLECTCVLRQRVSHYLTPQYGSDIPWDQGFPFGRFVDKDVLVENISGLPLSQFRREAFAAVKSYLMLTGRKMSHRTLRPYEVFRQLFATKDASGFDELCKGIRLLVLVFDGDDPWKNTYPREIPWLLRMRRDHALATWIISSMPLKGERFSERYPGLRKPLLDFTAEFIRLPLN